eukprot:561682-Amphidinium_carterae.1
MEFHSDFSESVAIKKTIGVITMFQLIAALHSCHSSYPSFQQADLLHMCAVETKAVMRMVSVFGSFPPAHNVISIHTVRHLVNADEA